MPNWTFNTINASEEVIADIKQRFFNKNGDFNFNYLIPMPKSLDVTSGSTNSEDIYYFLSKKNRLSFAEVMRENEADTYISFDMSIIDKNTADRVAKRLTAGDEPDYEMGRTLIDNYHKYRHITWYGWCNENWGTKWNACDTYAENEAIHFNTAWNAPEPILRKLCMIYPDESIDFYCEEETGLYVEYDNVNGDLVIIDEGELGYNEEDEYETV